MMNALKIIKLMALTAVIACGCSLSEGDVLPVAVTFHIENGGYFPRAGNVAPPQGIWDLNLYVYDAYGLPEIHDYYQFEPHKEGDFDLPVEIVGGKCCNVFALANLGYKTPDFAMEDLLSKRFFMAYPDEYSHGMLQSGMLADYTVKGDETVALVLDRAMAKLSLKIDRSNLDRDVDFHVSSVKVGNCPKSFCAFAPTALSGADDAFKEGFALGGAQTGRLNRSDSKGMSDEVSLYMLENRPEVPEKTLCTYIEMSMDYLSDKYYTPGDKPLIYRFFVNEKGDFDVCRGCHYHVTATPHGNGLAGEDSWRVDKSGVTLREDAPHMRLSPGGTTVDGKFYPFYYELERGGDMHFKLDVFPPSMRVSLREDLVQDALEDSRARFTMDADGNGFTVQSLGPACEILMEVIPSEPLGRDAAEIIVIHVY